MITTLFPNIQNHEPEKIKPPEKQKRKLPKKVSQPFLRRLMGMKECAHYLDITIGTLYVWVWQRRLPRIKVGKLNKFDRTAIDAWVDQNSIPPSN